MPPKARIAKRRTPVGSTAWNLPWSTSVADASTPVDGIRRAGRLASGSWIRSPPISSTPLGELVS